MLILFPVPLYLAVLGRKRSEYCWIIPEMRSPQVQDVITLVFPSRSKRLGFALINEIMLFGIISELISRITWSLPLVYSVYFGKIYRFIYAKFPKGNIIVGKRWIQDFRAQHTCYWARLRTAKGLFFDTFLWSCMKTLRMGRF